MSSHIRLFVALSLVCTLFVIGSARAVTLQQTHILKFYIDPSLVSDMQFAKNVLPKYVADMNVVLAKNTNRQFSFDPDTGIILSTSTPKSSVSISPPPTGYEVWAHIGVSTSTFSYGGLMAVDKSGAAILENMHWKKLYDPDTLVPGSDALRDYWIEVDHMLHEFGHVSGAAYGEYYNLGTVTDKTGVLPTLNISVLNPKDIFWSDKTDFFNDPMLKMLSIKATTTRQSLLALAQYSNLTAADINGNYRRPKLSPPTVDLNNIQLNVINKKTLLPLADAVINIWAIKGCCNNVATLLYTGHTDSNGTYIFAWGGIGDVHNNFDFLRLIKVSKAGFSSEAKYVSIYDTDIARLVEGKNVYTATMMLVATNTPPTAALGGPSSATVGTTITFSAAGSTDPEGDPLTYLWNFGDGQLASTTATTTTHTYVAAGIYKVFLTATDGALVSMPATTTVTIIAPPPPPPTVANLIKSKAIMGVSATTTTITWITTTYTRGSVKYTSATGSGEMEDLDPHYKYSHAVRFVNLTPKTLYTFTITAFTSTTTSATSFTSWTGR